MLKGVYEVSYMVTVCDMVDMCDMVEVCDIDGLRSPEEGVDADVRTGCVGIGGRHGCLRVQYLGGCVRGCEREGYVRERGV